MSLTVELAWPNGKPKVKDRPRWGGGRMYTPKETMQVEEAIAAQWVSEGHPMFTAPVSVSYEFYNELIVVTVEDADDYTNRKLRGDLDNYEKLVNDALNKKAWEDDRLIVQLASRKV